MKRLLFFAAFVALGAVPAASQASSFGLTYSRQCSSCGLCIRPYNAFSSVTCGVVSNCGAGGGCNSGGFNKFGPSCSGGGSGCASGHCAAGGGGVWSGQLRGRLFGTKHYPVYPEDGESGAFGGVGGDVAFYGSPANRSGYNPGCHMAWGWNNTAVNVPGHTPPPGPYVQGPNPSCTNVWLPPRPFPGMYGMQGYGYYPMPYYPMMPYAAPQQQQQNPQIAPASYQQYNGQGAYGYPMWYYYGQ